MILFYCFFCRNNHSFGICVFLYMQLCRLTAKGRKPALGNATHNSTSLAGELVLGFTHLWNQKYQGICVALPISAEQGLRFFATSTDQSINLCEPQLWKLPCTFVIFPWWIKGKLPLKWRAHCLLRENVRLQNASGSHTKQNLTIRILKIIITQQDFRIHINSQEKRNAAHAEVNVLLNSGDIGTPGIIKEGMILPGMYRTPRFISSRAPCQSFPVSHPLKQPDYFKAPYMLKVNF